VIGQLFVRYKLNFHVPNVQSSLSPFQAGSWGTVSSLSGTLNFANLVSDSNNQGITFTGVSPNQFSFHVNSFTGANFMIVSEVVSSVYTSGYIDLSAGSVSGGSLGPFYGTGNTSFSMIGVGGSTGLGSISHIFVVPTSSTITVQGIHNNYSGTNTVFNLYIVSIPSGVDIYPLEFCKLREFDRAGNQIRNMPFVRHNKIVKRGLPDSKYYDYAPKVPYGQQVTMIDNYGPPQIVEFAPATQDVVVREYKGDDIKSEPEDIVEVLKDHKMILYESKSPLYQRFTGPLFTAVSLGADKTLFEFYAHALQLSFKKDYSTRMHLFAPSDNNDLPLGEFDYQKSYVGKHSLDYYTRASEDISDSAGFIQSQEVSKPASRSSSKSRGL